LLREGAEEKTDLFILPEAALPFRPWGGAAGVYKMSEQDLKMGIPFAYAVQELGVPLVTGAVLASEKGWFNSALLYEPAKGKAAGEVTPNDLIRARYDKRGLLAFGEKLPFEPILGWLRKYLPGLGTGFEAGEGPMTFETVVPLEMSICYEAILPPMTREAVKTEKGVLLNLTNDAWFGKGDERHQHWSLAVWRTIENGVWLLRATNTGRTSIVDPAGRETARAPESERAILRAAVRPASLPTFYRTTGHFFPTVCALWVLSGLALSYQRRFMGIPSP
ncbi:MAG: apolipoprotein N-acyltransferase, partial [Bdellovibrionota bacterium]